MGENGRGRPETIYIETDRDRELREGKERANRTIEAIFTSLEEQYENPSDETTDLALRDMLIRDADEVPDFLKPYMGLDASEIPEDVFIKTKELLKMPFHKGEHSREVVDRIVKIMDEMENGGVTITEDEHQLGRLLAAGHDLVQGWKTIQHDNGKLERRRFGGGNERASAAMIIEMMQEQGFENIDEELVGLALDSTIPGWDENNNTVEQFALFSDSHPVTRALALADLGAAGMDSKSYIRGGNELFVEENLDMLNLGLDSLDNEAKESYMERMLAWSKSQISFAKGRQARFKKELGNLVNTKAEDQLKQLFSEFDESIQKSEEAYQRRRGLSFEDLYQVMGFSSKQV